MNSTPDLNTFEGLGLDERICKRLDQLGFKTPTACQSASIPKLFKEKKSFIQAPTGQGKTLAFLSYAFDILLKMKDEGAELSFPRILIVAPTRNLTSQIHDLAVKINKTLGFKISGLWGSHIDLDYESDMIVTTTGALLSGCEDMHHLLERVNFLVLDEADRLFENDFFEQTDAILTCVPKKVHLTLCSATLSQALKKRFHIKVDEKDNQPAKTARIRQRAVFLKETQKASWLVEWLKSDDCKKAKKIIIFVSSRANVDELTKLLKRQFPRSVHPLHGGMTDMGRKLQINKFEQNGKQLLVSTDLSGRGMDFKNTIDLVVNYDTPVSAEAYLHRIGRSGRGDKRGDSIALFTISQRRVLAMIEKELKQKIPVIPS